MTLTLRYVEVTGPDQGERLGRYPLQDGDVVIADRGYNQPDAIVRLVTQAIHVVIRLNPWAMPLYRRTGERLDLMEHLQRVTTDYHCLPVWLGKPGSACEAEVHAYRLAAAEAARRRCRQSAQGRTPREPHIVSGRLGVGLHDRATRGARDRNGHGPIPAALASRS